MHIMLFANNVHKHRFDLSHTLVSSERGNLQFFLPKEEQTAAAWACWRTNTPPDLSLKDMSPGETGIPKFPLSPAGSSAGLCFAL